MFRYYGGGGVVRKQASHQHLSLGATTQQHTPPPTYMPGYSPFHCKPQILIYILVLGNMKNGDILICTHMKHTLFSLGMAGALMPTQQFLKIKLCVRDALGCSHEALLLFIINGVRMV